MLNDGAPPDDQAGDLEYTLLLEGIDELSNGTYTIEVTAYDIEGASDTSSVQLIVDIPSQSSQVKGSQTGIDTGLVIVAVIVVLLIVLGMVGLILSRTRRRKQGLQGAQQPYGRGYPGTGYTQMPVGTSARFQPVNRR
jgi:hypothetical protein